MGLVTPAAPDFDVEDWKGRPYFERLRLMCASWADQGFGAPGTVYVFYVVKLLAYVGGFVAVVVITPGPPGGVSPSLGNISDWWASPEVLSKAVVWTLLWESVGLGCGSGPLTGRYLPPVTAIGHWLRPGTTRLPPWPWLPGTSGTRRNVVDVVCYAAFLVAAIRTLTVAEMTWTVVLPVVILLGFAGVRDKAVFLSARPEHYLVATVVLMFPGDLIAGQKVVLVAIWWWAATSKLNRHFPSVVATMLANNPLLRPRRLRRALYRHYPDDLRPSAGTTALAHGATVVEYTFPLLLIVGNGGWVTTVGLVTMVVFHLSILTSFPLGVPLEWNVFFIYAGLVLFGQYATVPLWDIGSPLLVAVLVVCLVVVPIVGNLRPEKVSFLPSMRYYAGNWATGVWCMRPGVLERIGDAFPTAATTPRRQLDRLYGPGFFDVVLGRTQAFRSLHLHGRAINAVLGAALADPGRPGSPVDAGACEVVDGELVAGVVLGWNFGDGHLHHEALLDVVAARLNPEPGDIRCVFVESQRLGDDTHRWRLVDAARGCVASGTVRTRDLVGTQPWDHDPVVLNTNPGCRPGDGSSHDGGHDGGHDHDPGGSSHHTGA